MARAETTTQEELAALQKEIEQLQVLQRISQDLVSEVDIDLLLHGILRSAIEVMEASAGSLMLLDDVHSSDNDAIFRWNTLHRASKPSIIPGDDLYCIALLDSVHSTTS